jgi:nitroimidazol reductase NimA-like FMN-containing flavoprotein (pyridoxamine 5'-phosphate oxidase superfamily)
MQKTPTEGRTPPPVEKLDEASCWGLLKRLQVGRLGIQAGDGVEIFPVNYAVHSRTIVLRSTHGEKLVDLTIRPRVAFEIDGRDGQELWSVVVKGLARTPESPDELRELHELRVGSYSPVPKTAYVVIHPESVTGRRFTQHREHDPDWR